MPSIEQAKISRRNFLKVTAGATGLAAVSFACGVDKPVHRIGPKPPVDPSVDPPVVVPVDRPVQVADANLSATSLCRCPQCLQREKLGSWHMPDESSVFMDHLRVYHECRLNPFAAS